MRIGLVMDASCDLPRSFIDAHQITVLPITIRVDKQTFVDRRDPEETTRFLTEDLAGRSHDALTEPYSAESIRELFLERLVTDFDCVFCLTVTSTRSGIHANATQASYAVLKDYRPVREKAGATGPFLLRVVDTQTVFAGSGVVVYEAVRMIGEGHTPGQIRERIEQVAQHAYTYMLPRDLYYLRARAKKKGDRSVGLVGATLGSALDIKPVLRAYRGETGPVAKMRGFDTGAEAVFRHTVERIQAGLMVPAVSVSYGGTIRDLESLPGYKELRVACTEHGVALLESEMSITGMVNVGQGALAVGFACEPYEPVF